MHTCLHIVEAKNSTGQKTMDQQVAHDRQIFYLEQVVFTNFVISCRLLETRFYIESELLDSLQEWESLATLG